MNSRFILIVDDNPTNLSVISQALRSANWQIRIAVSGEDALNKVAQDLPELILLDVQMPGIDGFEVCQRLKANPTTVDIPIIFMTALADTNNRVKGLSLGAVDYITKPFEQEEVIARIRLHLQLRHMTQTLEQQVEERTAQLSRALEELQHSQLQIIQSEKMSTLGSLVAGVAHEINNPIGCIVGNVVAIEDSIADLFEVIDLYSQRLPNPDALMLEALEAIDLDYLRQDLPKLVNAMKESSDRIKSISTSLRTFSRTDTEQPIACNIHDCIDSTILILKHRLKSNSDRPEIQVITHYGDLPLVKCYSGQLNQVFMNILANAIDTFDELAQNQSYDEPEKHLQQIIISTNLLENHIQIGIRDNGKGMTEAIRAKIFDHSFTTKPVGKGTGLGLAIARQIVVEKHGGSLEVQSKPGQGTEFCIRLPIVG